MTTEKADLLREVDAPGFRQAGTRKTPVAVSHEIHPLNLPDSSVLCTRSTAKDLVGCKTLPGPSGVSHVSIRHSHVAKVARPSWALSLF